MLCRLCSFQIQTHFSLCLFFNCAVVFSGNCEKRKAVFFSPPLTHFSCRVLSCRPEVVCGLSFFHSQGYCLEGPWWFATGLYSYPFRIWDATYLTSVCFSWLEWAIILIIPMYTVLFPNWLLRFQFVCDLPGCCLLFLRIWGLLWVRLFLPLSLCFTVQSTIPLHFLCFIDWPWADYFPASAS